jgi:5-methylthioadenosine/S-adenosylhomocysteine deaminase
VISRRVLAAVLGLSAGFLSPSGVTADSASQQTVWSALDGILIKGATVVTMDNAHTVIPHARVLVRNHKISAIWTGRTPPVGVVVGNAKVVDAGPDDLLFPGLINLHSHPSFNALHTWPPPTSDAIPAEGKDGTDPYSNRYQWGGGGLTVNAPPEYRRLVANPANVLSDSWGLNLYGELVKYAEVAALLGGETAIQGSANDLESNHILIRNIGAPTEFGGHVKSRVPSIAQLVDDPAAVGNLLNKMASGDLDAWIVHLAEGVDEPSQEEFALLKEAGLLTDMTVIVHGIALKSSDFAAMKSAQPLGDNDGDGRGAKLVWSPLSNLLLYGATANVYRAIDAGVLVSLGTDWYPSGSRTLLQELKVADIAARDPRVLGTSRELVPEFALKNKGPLQRLAAENALDRALVDMVTRNPALTLRWYDRVGSIEVGKVADLVLVRRPSARGLSINATVYRELINATERDVELVLVGGDPLAGDVDLMQQLKKRDKEIVTCVIGGFTKAVDVTTAEPGIPEGTEALAEFTAEIEAGLAALGGKPNRLGATKYGYLKAHMQGGFWADRPYARFELFLAGHVGRKIDGNLNIEAIQLAPLFAEDDDFLGHILRAETDAGGLIDDQTPPFALYPSNFNQIGPRGNPFAGWSVSGN